MDNEDSNEVMSIVSNESDPPCVNLLDDGDKPLIKLFERLINNDTKQNTVLTNAQIMNILQKEFDMDISCFREMEIEIYLDLMKKFLKNWPLWDEFDLAIQILKKKNNAEGINELLQVKYEHIKEFLRNMLSLAEQPVKKAIDEVKVASKSKIGPKSDPNIDSVVLAINCTRSQLNNLFYRKPHPDLGNTIFNIDSIPRTITQETFTLKSILNWPDIKIYIQAFITMRRDSIHSLKHVLVNKKNNCNLVKPVELKTNLQLKEVKKCKEISKQTVEERLEQLLEATSNRELRVLVHEICDIIKEDLQSYPSYIKMPVTYRKTMNKYPYVRYLFSEVSSSQHHDDHQYDLQLEETMCPQTLMRISLINSVISANCFTGTPTENWLKIECFSCKSYFTGLDICSELKQHFAEYHHNESDWQCTNCKVMFSMVKLAEDNWHHVCAPY